MTFDCQLKKMGFVHVQTSSVPYLYASSDKIIAVYVDDILLATRPQKRLEEAKRALASQFQVKDLGELHYFLGMKIIQNHEDKSILIGQTTYTATVLQQFGMTYAELVATPVNVGTKLMKATKDNELVDKALYRSAMGSLQYLLTTTRPDIAYAVSKSLHETNKGLLDCSKVDPEVSQWYFEL